MGSKARWLEYLILNPAVLVWIPSALKIFSWERIVNVAEVNQQRCLEESGQWLENVNRTHLHGTSGKLVIQKTLCFPLKA